MPTLTVAGTKSPDWMQHGMQALASALPNADYALLWTNEDPNSEGYLPENRIWANEFVALYKHGPVKAAAVRRTMDDGR